VGLPDHGPLQRLSAISCTALIIQGDNDLMIPTPLSHLMAGLIPDARTASLVGASRPSWRSMKRPRNSVPFAYPKEVATEVNAFLA